MYFKGQHNEEKHFMTVVTALCIEYAVLTELHYNKLKYETDLYVTSLAGRLYIQLRLFVCLSAYLVVF